MKTKRFNIALIPQKEVFNEAIAKSMWLSKKGNPLFVLDGKNFIPHVTLYSPEFPEDNLGQIKNKLTYIANKTSNFVVNFTEIEEEDGFLIVNLERNSELISLHKKVLNETNPLREGVLREKYKDKNFLQNLPDNKRFNIDRYGYTNVLSNYSPHLTIIRFENDDEAVELKNEFEWEIEKFKIERIGIFEMGANGTCTKHIYEVPLT